MIPSQRPLGTSIPPSSATEAWSPSSDVAISQAISKWKLDQVGWRGFESLPWVTALHEKYPDVKQIASTCSSRNERYRDEVTTLVAHIDRRDFGDVKSYFVGKLALEELSCRRSGAGAGMCDKRTAFMSIFEMLKQGPPAAT
ncbi:MAG: hypothetical protein EB084_10360 [Proteobacteria bacterium]|nr:hypothetical protein [Pseudomonadota bacterium]